MPLFHPLCAVGSTRAAWSTEAWSAEDESRHADGEDDGERDEEDAEREAAMIALDDDGGGSFDRVALVVDQLDHLDLAVGRPPVAVGTPDGDGGERADGEDGKREEYGTTTHYTNPFRWRRERVFSRNVGDRPIPMIQVWKGDVNRV